MSNPTLFQALVVASKAEDHAKMIVGAEPFFAQMAADNRFAVDFTEDADVINDANLAQYQVFVMLHLAPFRHDHRAAGGIAEVYRGRRRMGGHPWGRADRQGVLVARHNLLAMVRGIDGRRHLLSPSGVPKRHRPRRRSRASATRNLPARLEISDEWYEFDRSPRGQGHILAVADESTYKPNKPMGDHPVIWTNEQYRRAIYIAIGHDPSLLANENFAVLLRDSVLWAGSAS